MTFRSVVQRSLSFRRVATNAPRRSFINTYSAQPLKQPTLSVLKLATAAAVLGSAVALTSLSNASDGKEDTELLKRYHAWANTMPTDPEAYKIVESYEKSESWIRVDGVMVDRLGVKSAQGHVITDSLGLQTNAIKLHRMYLNRDADELVLLAQFSDGITGHEGVVHGGVIAMLFDNAMGWMSAASRLREANKLHYLLDPNASLEDFLKIARYIGFTANLSVNYRKPLLVKHHNMAILRTRDVKSEGRKLFLEAEIDNSEGERIADASSLYIQPRERKRPSK